MVGIPPRTLFGLKPSARSADRPCRSGLLQEPDSGPLVLMKIRSTALAKLSSWPNSSFCISGAKVLCSIAAPSGMLVSMERYHTGRPKLKPLIRLTVTINLINGFSFGRPVWYLSMDTSIPLGAAIEHNTFAPLMQKILLGHDDSFASSVERIFISTNGPESGGCNNPLRQGLSADLADGFRPNNVVGGIPTIALDYSPYWDAQLFEWTQDAIDQGFRGQVREEFQILTFGQAKVRTGPGGATFGSSGFSINCPIVQRLD